MEKNARREYSKKETIIIAKWFWLKVDLAQSGVTLQRISLKIPQRRADMPLYNPVNYRLRSDEGILCSITSPLSRLTCTFNSVDNCTMNTENSKRTAAPDARTSPRSAKRFPPPSTQRGRPVMMGCFRPSLRLYRRLDTAPTSISSCFLFDLVVHSHRRLVLWSVSR